MLGRLRHRTSSRRARDDELASLLETVRDVRTSLAMDLSAAAGALDAGHPEVARDILAASSSDIGRRRQGLSRPPSRPSRRRALLALPAVPIIGAVAMTAAAAISGGLTHHATPAAVTRPHTVAHATASTTLHQLESIVAQHAGASQVLAVADDLHAQLSVLIAASTNNPAQLHMVRRLLTLEQQVLEASGAPGTQQALAASRKLARLLAHQPHSAPNAQQQQLPSNPQPSSSASPSSNPSASPHHTRHHHNSSGSSSTPSSSPAASPTPGLFRNGVLGHR
jgi:hypothetical protein